MRTVLRHIVTGLYLESVDSWTGKTEAALTFDRMGEAIGFARRSDLRDLELVFVSEAAGPLLRLPLETIQYSTNLPLGNPLPSASLQPVQFGP